MNNFRENAQLHEHNLRQERLVFECSITANATPANKVHQVDIPSAVFLRTEGKTAECDAVENLTSQVPAPVDTTGVFQIMIDDQANKFYTASVTADVGTVTVTKLISTGGRVVLMCDSNQSLATQSLTLTVSVDYRSK